MGSPHHPPARRAPDRPPDHNVEVSQRPPSPRLDFCTRQDNTPIGLRGKTWPQLLLAHLGRPPSWGPPAAQQFFISISRAAPPKNISFCTHPYGTADPQALPKQIGLPYHEVVLRCTKPSLERRSRAPLIPGDLGSHMLHLLHNLKRSEEPGSALLPRLLATPSSLSCPHQSSGSGPTAQQCHSATLVDIPKLPCDLGRSHTSAKLFHSRRPGRIRAPVSRH